MRILISIIFIISTLYYIGVYAQEWRNYFSVTNNCTTLYPEDARWNKSSYLESYTTCTKTFDAYEILLKETFDSLESSEKESNTKNLDASNTKLKALHDFIRVYGIMLTNDSTLNKNNSTWMISYATKRDLMLKELEKYQKNIDWRLIESQTNDVSNSMQKIQESFKKIREATNTISIQTGSVNQNNTSNSDAIKSMAYECKPGYQMNKITKKCRKALKTKVKLNP